jgi:hypothetical protein
VDTTFDDFRGAFLTALFAKAGAGAGSGEKAFAPTDMTNFGDLWLKLGSLALEYAFIIPVRRCRLTVSKTELKARLLSALETENVMICFQTSLSIATCATTSRPTTSSSCAASPPSRAGPYTRPLFGSS